MPLPAPHHWLQRRTTTLLALVLITAMSASLAWQTANWLRLLSTPVAANAAAENKTPGTALTPQIGQIFGNTAANNDGPAPKTNLRLTLLGSFVHADPQRSTAIIRSEGSPAQRYTLDSEISSGVRLHSVAADRVELMRNGRRESLSFPLSDSAATVLQSSTTNMSNDTIEQLSDMQTDDLSQLRERMDALRQQMQDTAGLPGSAEPTEQPTENN